VAAETGHRPVRFRFSGLGCPSEDRSALIIQLYREPIPVETRDALFNQALDSLVVKSGALEYFRALHGNLAELFGLNAVGAQQASDCLRRWLESRNFKQ
jgi:hypothetical protein